MVSYRLILPIKQYLVHPENCIGICLWKMLVAQLVSKLSQPLWNPHILYRGHRSMTFMCFLNQIISFQSLMFYTFLRCSN